MLRYLRLFAYFVRFSVSRSMEFRFDFFFRVIMDVGYYALNLAFFGILYGHVAELGTWTEPQAMVFVAGYLFVDAIHMTLFSNNAWWLTIFINRGDLDYYLARPVSSLFFLSLRDFAANSFLNFLMTVGILIWALNRYPEPLGAGNIAMYIGLLFVGAYIHYALQWLFLIPTFWTHSDNGLRFLYFSTMTLSERPHMIFPSWMRRVLLSLFPAAIIASLPADTLFHGLTPTRALHFAAVTLGLAVVQVMFWRRGLRAYSSASS